MERETLKGHLDMLLLVVVSAGAAHGYAIVKRLAETSGGVLDLPEGTLYPALHRLEDKQLLESSWATAGGRKRRIYGITPTGAEALAKQRQEWGSFAKAVESVLAGG